MLHTKINELYVEIDRYINMFVNVKVLKNNLIKIYTYPLKNLWMKIILNIRMTILKNMNMKVIQNQNQNKIINDYYRLCFIPWRTNYRI